MRDSSYNFHTQTQQKFSRGGEKKVMKKSLSLLLSFALVFGLFASMASAADTTLTTAQKYQELKDKGILKGTTTGSDELGRTLTRAEFATIAIALAKLQEEKPATATFTDVTSKQWWYGAIEAAAKAGLVEGTGNGKFSPKNDVTVQEVIKIAAGIAGLKPVEDAKVEGAASWAAGAIQAALDAGLISTGLDYAAKATRGQTIDIGYAVFKAANPDVPTKVSVKEAKAAGVQKVAVTLDKAVDADKAKFTLKKGSVNVVLDKTTWSEDKKVATLVLKDVKISEGEYTVTLSGLDADSVATDSAKFTAQNESVKSIDFVTSVSEIAYSKKAKVKVAAKNQYEELASFPASYYSVFTGYNNTNERVVKAEDGHLNIVLDTDASGIIQGVSQIPLTIYFNDTRLTATKTFKVGNAPFVQKMQLGEVKYDGKKTSLTGAGEVANVAVNLFDQYGNPVNGEQITLSAANFNAFVTPQPNKLTVKVDDFNGDYDYEAKVTLSQKEAKSGTYTLTVYAGGASDTATISVTNGKVVTKVAFGDFDKTIAVGDTAKSFYVPVIGYDVDGNTLTKEELSDAINVARIVPNVSGPVNGFRFVDSGPNKGSIEIQGVTAAAIAKQVIFVSASITQIDAQDYKNTTITIQDQRVPTKLVLDGSGAAPKAVLGADSEFKYLIKDQYGETYTSLAGHKINVTYTNLDQTTSGTLLVAKDAANTVVGTRAADSGTFVYGSTDGAAFNAGFKFDTKPNQFGTVQFKAELIKLPHGTVTTDTTLSAVTQTIQSIDPTKVDLTYSLKDLGNLYAIVDSGLHRGEDPVTSHVHKQVKVAVKDSAGNDVAYPSELVQHVTVSNRVAVDAKADLTVNNPELPGSVTQTAYYVLGNKAGTATVNATVYGAKGEIIQTSGTVTVKADPVEVAKISAGNGDIKKASGTSTDAYALMDLKVVDSYDIEYTKTKIAEYNDLIGITYSITGIKGDATAKVYVDPNSHIVSINGNVKEFLLTATAANGKSASTLVYAP
ncbi:S-layer homology domain-containing protein [Cohnella terricola]|nr:S-layer homology domain-containing protein [Cohnella terricola]